MRQFGHVSGYAFALGGVDAGENGANISQSMTALSLSRGSPASERGWRSGFEGQTGCFAWGGSRRMSVSILGVVNFRRLRKSRGFIKVPFSCLSNGNEKQKVQRLLIPYR